MDRVPEYGSHTLLTHCRALEPRNHKHHPEMDQNSTFVVITVRTVKDEDVLFSGDDEWTQKIPEVRDGGLLVESAHRGHPVHRTDLHRNALSTEDKPFPHLL